MAVQRKYPSIKDTHADLISTLPMEELLPASSFPEADLSPLMITEPVDTNTPSGTTDQPLSQELARLMLVRRHYVNSKTAYPICEEYLTRLRAISKIAEIPISNVINNILALFFDPQGVLNPTNTAIKTYLNNSNASLKEYLGTPRPTSKKQ